MKTEDIKRMAQAWLQVQEASKKNEELKGNQHKLDHNKNGKIDADDFKGLRKKAKKESETEIVTTEAKADVYHKHMLKALGKSRLPKDHQYTSAIANNGDFVVKDGGGRTVGRIPKGEHNLNEQQIDESWRDGVSSRNASMHAKTAAQYRKKADNALTIAKRYKKDSEGYNKEMANHHSAMAKSIKSSYHAGDYYVNDAKKDHKAHMDAAKSYRSAMKEEVEQIDELSPDLKSRYAKKAATSLKRAATYKSKAQDDAAKASKNIDRGYGGDRSVNIDKQYNRLDRADAKVAKHDKTIAKRTAGLKRANEEVEQLDELSPKTLTSYAKASYNDVLKRRANRPAGKGDESDPKIGKRLAMNKLAHKKGAFKESVEELDEKVYASDYNVGHEKSQFGGYRPHVTHKKTGKTMYLGQTSYKKPEHAKGHAAAYLKGYEQIGDRTANRMANEYEKANKKHVYNENTEWPIYSRILENRAAHYKGATAPETMDDKLHGKGAKDMANQPVNKDDTLAKATDDVSKAGRVTKQAPGRNGDQSKGDKKVIASATPVKEELYLSDFTQEEIIDFMTTEAFAQLDELSKDTLSSYLKKAVKSGSDAQVKVNTIKNKAQGTGSTMSPRSQKALDKHKKTVDKRNKGVGSVFKRDQAKANPSYIHKPSATDRYRDGSAPGMTNKPASALHKSYKNRE